MRETDWGEDLGHRLHKNPIDGADLVNTSACRQKRVEIHDCSEVYSEPMSGREGNNLRDRKQ